MGTLFLIIFRSLMLFAQDDILAPVVVSSSSELSETGLFPERPLEELPLAGSLLNHEDLKKRNVQRLADISLLDASVTDSYNSVGYWDFLTVRGFVLDNRGSYLREGLPINAETSIPLDNKARIEVLRGLSGGQTGASSPGGVVNYVVDRPALSAGSFFETAVTNNANFLLHGRAQGRFSFAYENLRPAIENSEGSRYLLAFAQDWKFSENTVLEFEIENSQRSQASQAGMSLLGSTLPSVRDPRLNLNNQSWTQPVVFEALTGTLKLSQHLSSQWHWSLTLGGQWLRTDDRLAYAYGCSAEDTYDRYCSDGSFDVYDFRSDDERRTMEAARAQIQGPMTTGDVQHQISLALMQNSSRERFQRQAYNYVGVGNIREVTPLPADPSLTDESTQRDSRTWDVTFSDALTWERWTLWLGTRHTSLDRFSIRTDGSRATQFREDFLLPWAAVSYKSENIMTYLSYGEGLETYITPNRAEYQAPGVFVPAAVSRQYEWGIKKEGELSWEAALFEIRRPTITDQAPLYQLDGEARHRGLELKIRQRQSRWDVGLSSLFLDAKRVGSALTPEVNELRPVNVPAKTWRGYAEYRWSPTWSLRGQISREEDRAVTADNEILLPAWTKWDVSSTYVTRLLDQPLELTFYIENLWDEKYWRESPTQYSHIYLYAGMERTFTLRLLQRF